MRHHITTIFCFIVFLTNVNAQDRIHVDLEKTQFKLSILNPNLMLEVKVGEHQSINLSAGLVSSLGQTLTTNEILFFLHPIAKGSFRLYYGRNYVRKTLRPNSGNFVELVTGYVFDSIAGGDNYISASSNLFFVGPAWGIQRNYESGFLFGIGLGLGYGTGKNTSGTIASTGHLTLGFVFN